MLLGFEPWYMKSAYLIGTPTEKEIEKLSAKVQVALANAADQALMAAATLAIKLFAANKNGRVAIFSSIIARVTGATGAAFGI